MLPALLSLAGGLVLLVVGGELLVRGSVRIAERLGVSPLLIGLTLVGFGTSTPELVTSVEAARVGAPGIALGNIVGSNIANVLLILGLSALLAPLAVSSAALRRDGSMVIALSLLFAAAGYTFGLSRPVGLVFVTGLVGYMAWAYAQERNVARVEASGHTAAYDKEEAVARLDPGLAPRQARTAGLLASLLAAAVAVGGLAIIILGGRVLVAAAVDLARLLGMSESVIGLTVVAVGTSLPELVTSVVAAVRRQTDIAVGNVLGSNIYNILGIGGLTGLIAPTPFPPEMLGVDLAVMVGAAVLLFLLALDRKVVRWEGALMLGAYIGYTAWLVSRSG
ncbi:MAG: calcium/sodium antiporter [Thermaurantiacus tibetensis]